MFQPYPQVTRSHPDNMSFLTGNIHSDISLTRTLAPDRHYSLRYSVHETVSAVGCTDVAPLKPAEGFGAGPALTLQLFSNPRSGAGGNRDPRCAPPRPDSQPADAAWESTAKVTRTKRTD